MGQPEVAIRTGDRPWTVYVLVLLGITGLVLGLVFDAERTLWDILAIAVNLLLAWGLWTGRQWAFSISFMLASLCVALTLGALLIQVVLLESAFSERLLITAMIATIWVVLLLRPETKRFAGLDRPSVTA